MKNQHRILLIMRTELTHKISNDYRKYPGHLSVTVGSYKPEATQSVSLIRPMVQESDDEEFRTIHRNQDEELDAKTQSTGKKELVTAHLESRLPGQVLRIHLHSSFIFSKSQSANTNIKSILSYVNVRIEYCIDIGLRERNDVLVIMSNTDR